MWECWIMVSVVVIWNGLLEAWISTLRRWWKRCLMQLLWPQVITLNQDCPQFKVSESHSNLFSIYSFISFMPKIMIMCFFFYYLIWVVWFILLDSEYFSVVSWKICADKSLRTVIMFRYFVHAKLKHSFSLFMCFWWSGMDTWKRKQMHSHIYRTPEPFNNEVCA